MKLTSFLISLKQTLSTSMFSSFLFPLKPSSVFSSLSLRSKRNSALFTKYWQDVTVELTNKGPDKHNYNDVTRFHHVRVNRTNCALPIYCKEPQVERLNLTNPCYLPTSADCRHRFFFYELCPFLTWAVSTLHSFMPL